MKFSEALSVTLDQFQLSAKAIAQKAGVREATLSEFRRGKRDIHTGNLERLINALPPDAKQYLYLEMFVGQMDQRGMATILHAIANRLAPPALE